MPFDAGRVSVTLGAKLDDTQFRRYEKELDKIKARAARKEQFQTQLGGNFDARAFNAYERELKKSERATDEHVKAQGRLRTSFGSLYGSGGAVFAAAGGLAGLTLAVKGFVKASGEAQVSQDKMRAQLKALGIDYDAHAKEIDKVIQKTSQLAGLDDEDLQDAFTAIVRTTGKVSVGLKDMALVADLARAKHLDVAKAGEIVAKVHAGNVGALRRLGIAFVASTKNVDELKKSHDKYTPAELAAAKAADKHADSTRALGLLQQRYKGQAEAYGKTQQGAMDRVKVAFENLQETIGNKLAPTITKAANALAKFINDLGSGGKQSKGLAHEVSQLSDDVHSLEPAFKIASRIIGPVFSAALHSAVDSMAGVRQTLEGLARFIRGIVKTISGVMTGDWRKAWAGVKDIFGGGADTVVGIVRKMTAPLRAAGHAAGNALHVSLSSAFDGIIGTARGFVNTIIGVLNIIPGVNIHKLGGGGKTTPHPDAQTNLGSSDHLFEGGKATMPMAIIGEEAPQHPEWVIPTNPAYRGRAIGLWMQTARDLEIPGFALGGVLDFAKHLPGRAVKTVKGLTGFIGDKLPHNPGGMLAGAYDYALDHARAYIADKAKGLFSSVKGALSPGGSGGGRSSAGGQFDKSALRALWTRHGGAGGQTSNIAAAIALAESGGNPNARNSIGATGLWQIYNGPNTSLSLKDPDLNAGAAVGKWRGAHGFTPWTTYTGADTGPGGSPGPKTYLQFLARGGKVKHKAPKPTLSAKTNRGIKRSVARGESGISSFEDDIRRMERAYDQQDTRFGLSDEVLLIENPDGSTTVDQGALSARLGELDALTKMREAIKAKIEAYRRAIAKLMGSLRDAIRKLEKALGQAKGKARQKERGGYRQAISDYRDRLGELKGTHTDLGFDVEDQRIDLLELGGERSAVAGTIGSAAPAVDPGSPDTSGPDTGGSDTPDPTPAPPTAADIAAAAIQDFSNYLAGARDLYSSFGANALASRSAGSLFLNPDLATSTAGARFFGATGGGILGGAPGSGVTIVNNYNQLPDNTHTWSSQMRFQVEAAT